MATAAVTRRSSVRRKRAPDTDPLEVPTAPIWRITVEQYDEMIRTGILTDEDPVELLEGCLVQKMPKIDPHVLSGKLLRLELEKLVPPGWHIATQDPIRLSDSQPEPDISVVRGAPRDFAKSKPTPSAVGLVVEVSDSSLERDRDWKKTLYARAGIDIYWIVNLPAEMIEVFTDPSGPTKRPDFRKHQVYSAKQRVPVLLKGKKVGTLLVADVLP